MQAERALTSDEPPGLLHGVPTATKDLLGFQPGWPVTVTVTVTVSTAPDINGGVLSSLRGVAAATVVAPGMGAAPGLMEPSVLDPGIVVPGDVEVLEVELAEVPQHVIPSAQEHEVPQACVWIPRRWFSDQGGK